MDDHTVHTIPNRFPIKRDVLPKTQVQIILEAKWLQCGIQVCTPKQQRRPLPSLLSLSQRHPTGTPLPPFRITTLDLLKTNVLYIFRYVESAELHFYSYGEKKILKEGIIPRRVEAKTTVPPPPPPTAARPRRPDGKRRRPTTLTTAVVACCVRQPAASYSSHPPLPRSTRRTRPGGAAVGAAAVGWPGGRTHAAPRPGRPSPGSSSRPWRPPSPGQSRQMSWSPVR